MRFFTNCSGIRSLCGVAAALLALLGARTGIAYEPYDAGVSNCAGGVYYAGEPYCAGYPPPAARSALDVPITWYFMPRRPGCARHNYRYQVEMPAPCQANLGGCGGEGARPGCAICDAVAPELLEGFTPLEFERLGQIPNDALLGPAVAGEK